MPLRILLLLIVWAASSCSLFAYEQETTMQEDQQGDPLPAYYIVEWGDTLYGISQKFGLSQAELVDINELENARLIYEGQKLLLREEEKDEALKHRVTDKPALEEKHKTSDPVREADLLSGHPPASAHDFLLDVRDADLRDVLSALALHLDKTIILLDEPVRVSFTIEGTSPLAALRLLLQDKGYDYIEKDGVFLVGRPERLHSDFIDEMVLSRFSLRYITADTLIQALSSFDLHPRTYHINTNPRAFWVQGTASELGRIREVVSALDCPDNTELELAAPLHRFALQYLSAEKFEDIVAELDMFEQFIIMPSNPKVFWVQGTPHDLERMHELIAALDRADNTGLPDIFVYVLRNISAADAEERLQLMKEDLDILPGVETMSFNFPEFSRELLVICPPHLQEEAYKILGQLDESRQRIRRPVDAASGPNARSELVARRELLAELTGVPISRMHVSGNLSGDNADPYHILWLEETPDKIQQVREMLDIIDAPRS